MPLTPVQSASALSPGAVASETATYGATPTAGNLLLCCGCSDTFMQMNNAGWTKRANANDFVDLTVWEKIAGAGEPTGIQVNAMSAASGGSSAPDSVGLWIVEFSGIVAVPFDKSATNSPGGTTNGTIASGTTTATSQADELALVVFGWNNSTGATTITGYSNSFTQNFQGLATGSSAGTSVNLAVAQLALNATGTESSTGNFSGSVSHPSGLIVTYKAAPVVFYPTANVNRGVRTKARAR